MSKIIIKMEGMPEENGHISLHDFVSQLSLLNSTLKKIDNTVAGGKQASTFKIVNLSHSSPSTVEIEPHTIPKMPDTTKLVVESFGNTYQAVKQGKFPKNVDLDIIENFRGLCKPIGKSISNTYIFFDHKEYDFTLKFKSELDGMLAEEEESYGTVIGRLEQINVHRKVNKFTVYPEIGPKKVECKFPEHLKDDAILGVDKRVEISGILKHYPNLDFPHSIFVQSIEVYPPEKELSDLEDLRGRAPDITGKLSSEEFIRGLRDAWT